MDSQKTQNCQSNPGGGKKKAGGITLPDFRLQTSDYKATINQNSLVLAQKQICRSMEQNREPRNKPTHLRSINLQ